MITIIAVGLPVLVVAATYALLPPGAVLEGLPRGPAEVDRSPLPYRTHLAWTVPVLAASFGLGVLLGWLQYTLLSEASGGEEWRFSWRATDGQLYAFIPGLFVGMVISFPFFVRALRRRYGDALVPLLERPFRDLTRRSLRQEIAIMPRVAAAIAVAAVVVNAAVFDTFLQVGDGVLRFSHFFSARTTQLAVADIREFAVHPWRIASDGMPARKDHLEIRLKDGEVIDTFLLIEERHILRLIAALEAEAGNAIPVSHLPDPG